MSNQRTESVLRKMRRDMDEYESNGKLAQCQRIIRRCKARLAPVWAARHDAVESRIMQNYMM